MGSCDGEATGSIVSTLPRFGMRKGSTGTGPVLISSLIDSCTVGEGLSSTVDMLGKSLPELEPTMGAAAITVLTGLESFSTNGSKTDAFSATSSWSFSLFPICTEVSASSLVVYSEAASSSNTAASFSGIPGRSAVLGTSTKEESLDRSAESNVSLLTSTLPECTIAELVSVGASSSELLDGFSAASSSFSGLTC